MLFKSIILLFLLGPTVPAAAAEIPDRELMKYFAAADQEYGCRQAAEPKDEEITVEQYRQMIGCHQLFLATDQYPEPFHLGKPISFHNRHRLGWNRNKGFAEAENKILATFDGLVPTQHPHRLSLSRADLVNMNFYDREDPLNFEFNNANLAGAGFYRMNLTGTNFFICDCRAVLFSYSNLNDADFSLANLEESEFIFTKLAGAHFDNAIVTRMRFNANPDFLPSGSTFVTTTGLSTLTFFGNVARTKWDGAILRLRDEIKKTGSREALREINFAIRSNPRHYDTPIDYWFNRILFGETVGYGLLLARPLVILAALIPIFALVYFYTMTKRSRSDGLFVSFDSNSIEYAPSERDNAQITLEQPYSDDIVTADFVSPQQSRPTLVEDGMPWVEEVRARLSTMRRWYLWIGPNENSKAVRGYFMAGYLFLVLSGIMILLPFAPEQQSIVRDQQKMIVNIVAANSTTEIRIHQDESIQPGITHAEYVAVSCLLIAPLILTSLFMCRNKYARQAWRMAVWFSLLSQFRFGWRELSLGTWLAMLQPKGYTLRAIGIPKAIAGLQSLIGLTLVGLWAFCYFIGPLE